MKKKVFKIGEKEIEFAKLGLRLRTTAAQELRRQREDAFARMLTSLPEQDPVRAATSASAAVEQYLAGAIVTDVDVQRWIILTPEGQEYVLKASYEKASGGEMTQSVLEDLMEDISFETFGAVIKFAAEGVIGSEPEEEQPKEEAPVVEPKEEAAE